MDLIVKTIKYVTVRRWCGGTGLKNGANVKNLKSPNQAARQKLCMRKKIRKASRAGAAMVGKESGSQGTARLEGTITQDSYPAWLHVGSARQMCVVHQERLVRRSGVESRRGRGRIPGGRLPSHRAWRIKDPHGLACIRNWGAVCRPVKTTGTAPSPNTAYREGYYMTMPGIPGISPDNNAVERANRRFVSVRNDGGGNRSRKGMDANSVLFTMLHWRP